MHKTRQLPQVVHQMHRSQPLGNRPKALEFHDRSIQLENRWLGTTVTTVMRNAVIHDDELQ